MTLQELQKIADSIPAEQDTPKDMLMLMPQPIELFYAGARDNVTNLLKEINRLNAEVTRLNDILAMNGEAVIAYSVHSGQNQLMITEYKLILNTIEKSFRKSPALSVRISESRSEPSVVLTESTQGLPATTPQGASVVRSAPSEAPVVEGTAAAFPKPAPVSRPKTPRTELN